MSGVFLLLRQALLAVVATAAGPAPHATPVGAPPPTAPELRVAIGFIPEVAGSAWVLANRMRLELGGYVLLDELRMWIAEGASTIRLGAPESRSFIGPRVGYRFADVATCQGSYSTHAFDAGLVAHAESKRAHVLEVALGPELIRRNAFAGCDSYLPGSSSGVRASVRGELAVSPASALYLELGLRTANHLHEIHVLPTLRLGLRVRW